MAVTLVSEPPRSWLPHRAPAGPDGRPRKRGRSRPTRPAPGYFVRVFLGRGGLRCGRFYDRRVSDLHEPLLEWYDEHARDLPWRRTTATPWHVLVSEVMLQQTPVARVLPVYVAWL